MEAVHAFKTTLLEWVHVLRLTPKKNYSGICEKQTGNHISPVHWFPGPEPAQHPQEAGACKYSTLHILKYTMYIITSIDLATYDTFILAVQQQLL